LFHIWGSQSTYQRWFRLGPLWVLLKFCTARGQ